MAGPLQQTGRGTAGRHAVLRAFRPAASTVISLSDMTPAGAVASPRPAFGSDFGADYQLATCTRPADYWRRIERESDRMVVQEIGKTSEDRPHRSIVLESLRTLPGQSWRSRIARGT